MVLPRCSATVRGTADSHRTIIYTMNRTKCRNLYCNTHAPIPLNVIVYCTAVTCKTVCILRLLLLLLSSNVVV